MESLKTHNLKSCEPPSTEKLSPLKSAWVKQWAFHTTCTCGFNSNGSCVEDVFRESIKEFWANLYYSL